MGALETHSASFSLIDPIRGEYKIDDRVCVHVFLSCVRKMKLKGLWNSRESTSISIAQVVPS